jgi:hypothetical protein
VRLTGFSALVVALVLGVTTTGVPGTLLLVGGYLLAVGIAGVSPKLSGPPSWAAAVVVEVTLLVGCSAALAIVSPHPHGAAISLAILSLPALGGAALYLLARTPRFRTSGGPPGAGRPGLALTATIFGLAVAAWIASRGKNFDVAWAMSGDARNHVQILRQVIGQGGLTLKELKTYPAVVNSVSALLSSAGGRAHLLPGDLMIHDAHAVATTYVLAGIATACMLIAALHEFVPRALHGERRLPVGITVVLLGCAAVSASPFVLGTALNDGFLSAYGTLPLVLAAVVLALRCTAIPSAAAFGLLAPATMIILFGWTPMVVVPMVLVGVLSVQLVRRSRSQEDPAAASRSAGRAWLLSGVLVGVTTLITLGVAVTQLTTLKKQFVTPGAITSPETKILLLLGLVSVGLLLASSDLLQRRQMLVPLSIALSGGLLVEWMISIEPGKTWSYYPIKTLWLFGASLIWIAFIPIIRYAASAPARPHRKHPLITLRTAEAAVLTFALLVLIGFATTVPNPLAQAETGWNQPTAKVVTETARVANRGTPFVLWQWSDLGDDRLGNFWAALTWDTTAAGWNIHNPKLKGGMKQWAYNENGLPSQFCQLLLGYPGIDVITRTHDLNSVLTQSCVGEHARVVAAGSSG